MAASWESTPGSLNLLGQFNQAFPARDKASDGRIGDLAHQRESASSHNPDLTGAPEWRDGDTRNEVRALDVDSDLRFPGVTMQDVIDHLRKLPGIASVIRYMIYNRKIYRAANGWAAEPYTGPSAHTEHAHFTMAFTQAADANTTFNYRFEELTMDEKSIAKAVWAELLPAPRTSDPSDTKPARDYQAWSPSFGQIDDLAALIVEQGKQIAALTAKVDKISVGGVDVPALVKAVNDDAARRAQA